MGALHSMWRRKVLRPLDVLSRLSPCQKWGCTIHALTFHAFPGCCGAVRLHTLSFTLHCRRNYNPISPQLFHPVHQYERLANRRAPIRQRGGGGGIMIWDKIGISGRWNVLLNRLPWVDPHPHIRGLIASVQKAGRASERARKRVAEEVAEEEVGDKSNGEASRVVTRAAKKAKVTGSSERRKIWLSL